ncbi:septal ring lytic transglycosylase RlpA family protein [Aquabacterium sp.]|uniref:septal ring lytic transglycosylase RlpA family protein n=1 Tax=Aquabacterium sp. TaxID=1872578 RepID=UPI0035B26149
MQAFGLTRAGAVRAGAPALRVSWRAWVALLAVATLLGGCASGPAPSGSTATAPARSRPLPPGSDGPPDNPPSDLALVPDAEPRIEPIRPGGPNKPYTVLGRSYEPQTADAPWRERGSASWYGRKFHGRRTASGEVYSMYGMTAAHRTLPIPSYARVRNVANGREVIVRVNDRGPFHSDRIMDLSYTAALKLGVLGGGTAQVEIERLTFADIRTGAWRRDVVPTVAEAPGAGVAPVAAVAPPTAPVLVQPQGKEAVAALVAPATLPRPSGSSVASALPPDLRPTDGPAASNSEVYAVQPSTRGKVADYAASGYAGVRPGAVASAEVSSAALPAVGPASPAPDLPPEQRARAYTADAQGFWVQLGAFRQREGAENFQRRVASEYDVLSPLLAIFSEASIFRLQAGPYASRDEARSVARKVREVLSLVPVIVERR